MPGSRWKDRSAFVTTRRLNTLIQPSGNSLRFSFEGDLDSGTIRSLVPIMQEIQSDGVSDIIFDLERVEFVDKAGVSFIEETCQKLKSTSGKLVCVSTRNQAVRRLLEDSLESILFLSEAEDPAEQSSS